MWLTGFVVGVVVGFFLAICTGLFMTYYTTLRNDRHKQQNQDSN